MSTRRTLFKISPVPSSDKLLGLRKIFCPVRARSLHALSAEPKPVQGVPRKASILIVNIWNLGRGKGVVSGPVFKEEVTFTCLQLQVMMTPWPAAPTHWPVATPVLLTQLGEEQSVDEGHVTIVKPVVLHVTW